MELILGTETSAFKTQTPGNNPEDCTLYPQHGESLKSTITVLSASWNNALPDDGD
jgi:hypothetical protein